MQGVKQPGITCMPGVAREHDDGDDDDDDDHDHDHDDCSPDCSPERGPIADVLITLHCNALFAFYKKIDWTCCYLLVKFPNPTFGAII